MVSENATFFTNINYMVCCYCRNIAIAESHPSIVYGCGVHVKEDGIISREEEFDMVKGCDRFEPSGLPIHPTIFKELVKYNNLVRTIPIDKKAIETSYDFANKIEKFPHLECYVEDDSSLKVID